MPLISAVFLAFMLPYGAAFINAFKGRGVITVFENSALLHITLFTAKQAFLSVLLSLAIGLPGAWILGTSRSRFTPLFRTLTAIPFAMPSILAVLGFVLFFGNSGWANRFLAIFFGEGPLRILYKPEAIILAHGFFNFPLVIRLAGDGLARAKGAYASAASVLGAPPFMTALTVILPLSIPSVMSAALLVFLYSFTSFAIVLVLGGGPASTTLAVEIYRHAKIFLNYRNAGALAIVETLIAVSVFFTYIFFGKKSGEIKVGTEKRILETGEKRLSSRIIMLLYGVLIGIFILGPLLSVLMESILYRSSRSAPAVLSLRWWTNTGAASMSDTFLPALFRSLFLAFFSAAFSCLLAISGALSVRIIEENESENGRSRVAANIIRFFASAPIISSGIVMGLGWLIVYGGNLSPWAMVLLHGIFSLPFTFNFISEGFRSMPANILNAALISGANPLRGLLSTALPLSLPQLRSAWGFAAALSLGELNAVMMLGMENWETLPLYIYRAAGAYRYGTACAAGTLLILGCGVCLFLSESGRSKHGA